MKLNKIFIVDGSYLIHRALHVQNIFELKNTKGVGTGGIYQFLRSLNYNLRNYPDYYPIVTWDAGQSKRRLSIYPNYKHHEERMMDLNEAKELGLKHSTDENTDHYLEEYHTQRDNLIEVLHALGIPCLRLSGWEGDDLMYILSKFSKDCIVMTDDKDLIQLLSPTTKILRPMRNEFLIYDEYQKTHNDPKMRKFIITKAIIGDGSDNIPKCANGVGQKSAEWIANVIVTNPNNWKSIVSNAKRKFIRSFINEDSLKQFNINMQLIDLTKVDDEIDDNIKSIIESEIVTNLRKPDFFKTVSLLNDLEITDLDINQLVSDLTKRYKNNKYILDE